MLHHNNCLVCNSEEITPLLSCTDNLVSGEEFRLYGCTNCGFIFTQDAPDESGSARYYESADYISHTDSSRTFFEKIYQLVRKIMLRRKSNLAIKTTGIKGGAILDIGSGTGHFLNRMKQAGWRTTGIEINDDARKYSASHFGLNVLPPSEIGTLSDNSFDCITLWHVAEHLHDIKGYFRNFHRLLKPGGSLIVALPNSDSFDSELFGKDWAAWDVPRHLWHFDPGTFRLFAEREGFRLLSISPLPFDVFYISVLSEKNRKSKVPFIKGMLEGKILFIRTLFNRMKGSSVVYCLKTSDQ